MNKKSDISGITNTHQLTCIVGESQMKIRGHAHLPDAQPNEMENSHEHQFDLNKDQELQREMLETRGSAQPSIFNSNPPEKQNIAVEKANYTKPSSVISQNLYNEGKCLMQTASNQFATPGAESRSDVKSSSTFENSD